MTVEKPSHARPPAFSSRWLAAGGGAVLAAVIGVALVLQNGGSPACAAPPTGDAVRTGKATFYDLGGGQGNCSFPRAPANDLFVALGNSQYSAAGACGSYLDVTGPKGKVRVKVIDRCPECQPGHLDLSRTAFARIADEVQGIVPITYRAVTNPATPGPVSVRIKEGSSRYWFAALIDNHANPLASVTVKGPSGGPRSAKRADFNYWIIDGGAGPGPFSITATDVHGRQATATGVRLLPGQTQSTSVRLSGKGGAAGVATAPRTTKAAKKKPASSRSASTRPASTSARDSAQPSVAGSAVASGRATAPVPEPPAAAAAPGAAAVELAAGSGSCG